MNFLLHFCSSNTSILGQKKKNQKKKASRKRALDRRHSEGSESEKHDDFDEKVNCDFKNVCPWHSCTFRPYRRMRMTLGATITCRPI
jgi:hypothetical protein